MRRKLLLPALLAGCMLAISAPVASAISVKGVLSIINKALKPIKDVNAGQTAAIKSVDTRVDTIVGQVATIKAVQDAIVAGVPDIKNGLLALKDAATQLKDGLTALGDNYKADEYGIVQLFVGGVAIEHDGVQQQLRNAPRAQGVRAAREHHRAER